MLISNLHFWYDGDVMAFRCVIRVVSQPTSTNTKTLIRVAFRPHTQTQRQCYLLR